MFPLWEQMLPEGLGHHYNLTLTPACSFIERPPPMGVCFFRSCPACVIAQHAAAMKEPLSPVNHRQDDGGTVVLSMRESMNALIGEYRLPLPLVP